jgi:TolB-like protein/Flp pilus assembly protein TadD
MLPGASSGRQSGGWGQEMSGDAPKSGGGSPPIDPQMAVQGTKASPHVFISYASQDAAVAQRLCATLEAAGFPCWIAPRDVEAGALYADAIVRAINEAKAVVLVLSASAIASDHVAREVERAGSKHKPIIAFRIDAAALNPGLEYFLSNSQWIDVPAIGMPAALAKLAQAAGHGSGQTVAAVHVASAKPLERTGGRAKLIVGAAVVISVGVAVAFGLHWSQSHKAAPPGAAVAITDKSIAVLPFVDMSEKHDQEYFSDGLSEELIDMLTKVPELRVPARTSSFYFKGKQVTIADIAKALGVAHVLEGSVRKSGNTLRVTAQLIRVDNGYHVWSETYDRKLEDIFKVQDEIASAVVTALRVHLLPRQQRSAQGELRTENFEAYNLYLQGRQSYNQGDAAGYQAAVTAFRAATALDPHYGAAYADLAVAQWWVADTTGSTADYESALAAADKAVALAPELAAGYSARGFVRAVIRFDFAGAQADLDKAVALSPNDASVLHRSAVLLAILGKLPAAIAREEQALALDPLSAELCMRLAFFLVADQQLAQARPLYEKALAIAPNSIRARFNLGELELLENHPEQALATSRQNENEDFRLVGQAEAEYSLGHLDVSRRILEQLVAEAGKADAYNKADAFNIARVYAWRGEKDQALEWLERSYVQREPGLTWVEIDPRFRGLRDDARFRALLRKMNLPE